MSVETELKERLSAIAGDGHRAADEAEVWPLAVQMMDCLGSTDPELRDGLIYQTLARWSEWYLDTAQLDALLAVALAADHLTLDLGEQEGDAVFMRAFSSLAVAIFVGQHRARPYLGAERVHEVHRMMLAYLSRERDARGWVPGKGWADAVSHAADALDELAQCPELGEADLLETLQAIRETVVRTEAVFPGEEDERLVTAVVSAVRRGVLTRESIAAWILDFAALEAVGTYHEWFRRRANVKRFLRSLFFRSQYEGMAEWFEPALGETLQQISESPFTAGTGEDADGGEATVNRCA